jgi:hypothetical protein
MTGDSNPSAGFAAEVDQQLSDAAGEPAQLGLVTFSGGAGAGTIADACGPGVLQVAVTPDSSAQIDGVLEALAPMGATPTAASLRVAADALDNAFDATGRAKYIVLLTDGAPNCNGALVATSANCLEGTDQCASPGACVAADGTPESAAPYGCLDKDNTVSTVQDLHDNHGIDTFVIGFGADFASASSAANDTLNLMAQAGGEALAASPSFYRASTRQDLVDALTTVNNNLSKDCGFALTQPAPAQITAAQIQNGTQHFAIAVSALSLSSDRRQLTLQPSVCQQIPDHLVSFVFTP